MPRPTRWVAAALCAALTAAGCGAASSQAPAASAAPKAGAAQTTAKPAKPLKHVTLALAANVLPMSPLFVAQAEGYFADKGLSVSLPTIGGSAAVEAIRSGSVQFADDDSGTLADAVSKGAKIEAIETMADRVTLDLVLSNAVVQKDHLTMNTPLKQRLAALKGLRLGLVSPGGAVAVFTRYLVEQAGLVPGKDVKLVVIGAVPLLVAAMQRGQIDGFMSSPPGPEEAQALGAGKVILSGSQGQLPQWANFVYETVTTTPEYASAHPNTVRDMAEAVAMGNNLIRKDPAKALAVLQKHFSTFKPGLVASGLKDITPAIPLNGLTTQTDWSNALKLESSIGLFKGTLSPKEGVLWTNQYVQGVNGAT